MYTFAFTVCGLTAIFGILAIVFDAVLNRLVSFEDEVTDYETE